MQIQDCLSPLCISSQLYTMNFSCCVIAQPFHLVGLFCNSPQSAHVPVLLLNLVASTVFFFFFFTSSLVPFSSICVY